jgi:hypothetical protein
VSARAFVISTFRNEFFVYSIVSEEISIQIKVLSGATHSVRLPRDALVASLQARLADVADMPVPRQRLIFRGRVLLVWKEEGKKGKSRLVF